MEGLKLSSVDTTKIDSHISKALENYNPIGCPLIYILMYVTAKGFKEFWEKLVKHLMAFKFSYEVLEGLCEISTAYANSRHGKLILQRNGIPIEELFKQIDASDRTYEEVIEFLSTTN